MLLKRVVVTYKAMQFSGTQTTCNDDFEATGTDAYLTVHNNDDGQLIVANCSRFEEGEKSSVEVQTLAVYNTDVWEAWKIVREEKEE